MSTTTLDNNLMVESDRQPSDEVVRVQAYADKLQRDEWFRFQVFADMTTETTRLCLDRLENRFQEQGATALNRPYLKVPKGVVSYSPPIHFGNVRLTFEKLLNDPFKSQDLWENVAAWILKKLDAWNQKDQQPEDIPLIWARAKGAKTVEVSREDYLIQLCAFYVAGEWLQQLNLSALSLEALEKLLGYQGNISEDIDKLSHLQKEILRILFKRSGNNLLKPLAVPWESSTLLLEKVSTDRGTVSKSLLKLTERNLVERLDYEGDLIPAGGRATMRRTAFVRLTETGVLAAKVYQNETEITKIKLPTIR